MAERLSPLIRRVTANNPGPFTGTGTGSHIVGHGNVAVLDPGPDDPAHVAAILAALDGETLDAILVTHTHRDHSPAARALAAATGALVLGCAPLAAAAGPAAEAFDTDHAPTRVLADGEAIAGPGWTLTALSTPGHASNHLAFALEEERALFTGDHVMGWSTTVVAPPDGDMGDYLASLERLLSRDDLIYHPTHGEPVMQPQRHARGLLLHRRQREASILARVRQSASTVPALVAAMYAGVDARLYGAAGASVLAHLMDLRHRGLVRAADDAVWEAA